MKKPITISLCWPQGDGRLSGDYVANVLSMHGYPAMFHPQLKMGPYPDPKLSVVIGYSNRSKLTKREIENRRRWIFDVLTILSKYGYEQRKAVVQI